MNVKSMLKSYENAFVSACCKGGCRLKTHDMTNTVVLDVDQLSQDTRADCLIFSLHGILTIGVCEIKSKHLSVTKIEEQINSSIEFALKIRKSCFPDSRYRVIPILLAKAYKQGSVHGRLKRTKIKINGKKFSIRLKKCGDMFSDMIGSMRNAN